MKKEILKSLIRECLKEVKDVDDVEYVMYIKQMNGEEPFMMGGKKFEYVWAKYPSGKRDIGVYAFSGDVVYGYRHFRRMYNLDGGVDQVNESVKNPSVKTHFHVEKRDLSLGSRDPDAEREIVYQVMRVTSDPMGDDYHEEMVDEFYDESRAKNVALELNKRLASGQINEDVEHFSKSTHGTISVGGVEYEYDATVSGNIVGTPNPHGEFHSEIDESSVDIDITNVTPEPLEQQWELIDSAVFDDVMGKDLWDFVNEIQTFTMPKPARTVAKTINITGKRCVKCKKGKYGETSIHNDIEGTKTCNSCGHTLPTNSTKDDLLKEFKGELNKVVCYKCNREILPHETLHRMPMSGLCQHIPSCPTDPPLGEKPHDRDIRLGKLKENDTESEKQKDWNQYRKDTDSDVSWEKFRDNSR